MRYILTIFLCILLIFSGCADDVSYSQEKPLSKERLVLDFSFYGRDTNWIASVEKTVNDFSVLHPEYDIRLDFCTEGSYSEFINAKEATGTLPELFEIINPREYVEAGKLGQIPGELSRLLAAPYMENGACYALPVFSSINGIIYNKKIFEELDLTPPDTYQKFLSMCQALQLKGVTPIAFAGNDTQSWNNWGNYYFSLVLSENPDWLSQRNQNITTFDSPEIRKMLENYRELFEQQYVIESYSHLNESQLPAVMTNEKAAMVYANPGFFSLLTELDPDFPLGWFYLPDESGNPTAVNATISYWCISSQCTASPEKLEAVREFLSFFYAKEQYRSVLQATSTFSTTAQVVLYPSLEITQSLRAEYIYANVKSAYLGDLNTPPQFMNFYDEILKLVMLSVTDISEAVKQLDLYWSSYAETYS